MYLYLFIYIYIYIYIYLHIYIRPHPFRTSNQNTEACPSHPWAYFAGCLLALLGLLELLDALVHVRMSLLHAANARHTVCIQ